MSETKETILAKLKAVYEKHFGAQEPQKFAEMKTKDGSLIYVDGESPAAGVPVFIMDEAGEKSPAPDGEITLEDGTMITVKDGMIASVGGGEEGEAEMDETKLSKLEAAIKKLDIQKQVEEHKSAIAELKEAQKALKMSEEKEAEYVAKFAAIEADAAAQKEITNEIFKLVEKVLELPSESTKTATKKDGFSSVKSKSFKELADAAKAIKTSFKNIN